MADDKINRSIPDPRARKEMKAAARVTLTPEARQVITRPPPKPLI
jgi:hypothetical protein